MLISFSAREIGELARLAEGATRRSEHIANRSRRDLSKTQAEADLIGLKAEYAVASFVGLPMSACGVLDKGIKMDGGHDLVLASGSTVQVKGVQLRTNTNSKMWFSLEGTDPSEFTADWGVLVLLAPNPRYARLAGYVTRESLSARGSIVDLGTGDRLGVPSDRLLSMSNWIFGRF